MRRELEGLAVENSIDVSQGYDSVKWMELPFDSPAALFAASRGEPIAYYQQTFAAYLEGLSRAQPDAGMDVLEVGSDRTHHKLRVIEDLCNSAVAINIFFHVPQDSQSSRFVERILADMCDIPMASNTVDLVIASATLHHAPDLHIALGEIHRVLRPGGRAIVVNEPVEGVAKQLNSTGGHSRDELIHEDPVPFRTWTSAIRSCGFRADHFIPYWFTQQAAQLGDDTDRVRFGSLARRLGPVLSRPAVADASRLVGRIPAQWALGMPLNAVLWKI